MSSLPPIPENISIIAGPPITQLIGINLNWGLMGILMVQLYIYGYSFPNDPRFIKSLVYGLGALEFVQTLLATVDGFHWFAAGFGNMMTLNDPYISAFDSPFLDSVIALVVQLFFAYRIWVLTRSYFLTGAVAVVSMVGSGGGMAVGIQGHISGKFSDISKHIVAESMWLAGSALADTMIAVIMVTMLLRSRRSIPSTNNIILRLVRVTIETNTLTASVAVLALILFLIFRDQPTLTVPLSYVLGKLYTNTFLAMLNNRLLIAQEARGVVTKFNSTFAVRTANSVTTTFSPTCNTKKDSRHAINVGVLQSQISSSDPETVIPLDDMLKGGSLKTMFR